MFQTIHIICCLDNNQKKLEPITIHSDSVDMSEEAKSNLDFDQAKYENSGTEITIEKSNEDRLLALDDHAKRERFPDWKQFMLYLEVNSFYLKSDARKDFNGLVKIHFIINESKIFQNNLVNSKDLLLTDSDYQRIFDNIGLVLSFEKFMKYSDLMNLYTRKSFNDYLNECQLMIVKFNRYINHLKTVNNMADLTIEMKKKKEKASIMFHHLQNLAEGGSFKNNLINEYINNLSGKTLSDEVNEITNENLKKLKDLDKNNSEFNVIKNYLDIVTTMPFGIGSEEVFDLNVAKKILGNFLYWKNIFT